MRQSRIERRIGRPPSCASRPGWSIICWRAIESTDGCRRRCRGPTARERSGSAMKSRKSSRRPCERKQAHFVGQAFLEHRLSDADPGTQNRGMIQAQIEPGHHTRMDVDGQSEDRAPDGRSGDLIDDDQIHNGSAPRSRWRFVRICAPNGRAFGNSWTEYARNAAELTCLRQIGELSSCVSDAWMPARP